MTVDEGVSFIGSHFPLSTLTTEEEARRVIRMFRAAFGAVANLEPLAFIYRAGHDRTAIMYRDPRNGNVCHLGIRASIPVNTFSTAFDDKLGNVEMEYYVGLPKSFQAVPQTKYAPSTLSVDSKGLYGAASAVYTLDSDIFSPARSSTEIPASFISIKSGSNRKRVAAFTSLRGRGTSAKSLDNNMEKAGAKA